MKFLIDNCISPHVEKLLEVIARSKNDSHRVRSLKSKFNQGISDQECLKALGVEGDWVFVTKDPKIQRIPQERKAWIDSKVTAFFLDGSWGNLKLHDFAWRFFRWWPKILDTAGRAPVGAGFIVPLRFSETKPLKRLEV